MSWICVQGWRGDASLHHVISGAPVRLPGAAGAAGNDFGRRDAARRAAAHNQRGGGPCEPVQAGARAPELPGEYPAG